MDQINGIQFDKETINILKEREFINAYYDIKNNDLYIAHRHKLYYGFHDDQIIRIHKINIKNGENDKQFWNLLSNGIKNYKDDKKDNIDKDNIAKLLTTKIEKFIIDESNNYMYIIYPEWTVIASINMYNNNKNNNKNNNNNKYESNIIIDIIKTNKLFFNVTYASIYSDSKKTKFIIQQNAVVTLKENDDKYVSYKLQVCQDWNC